MNLSHEQAVSIVLIDYINAAPDHCAGLCYYLDNLLGDFPETGYAQFDFPTVRDSHQMIEEARQLLPEFGCGAYVDNYSGPSPLRQKFAAAVLTLIEQGRLYWDSDLDVWQVDHHGH
jgi:hypothetical protein